jgi:hypothetical protein
MNWKLPAPPPPAEDQAIFRQHRRIGGGGVLRLHRANVHMGAGQTRQAALIGQEEIRRGIGSRIERGRTGKRRKGWCHSGDWRHQPLNPKSEIQTGKMTQDLGAETNRKNRGIPKVVYRDFFNSFMPKRLCQIAGFNFGFRVKFVAMFMGPSPMTIVWPFSAGEKVMLAPPAALAMA